MRRHAREIVDSAIAAVNPSTAVRAHLVATDEGLSVATNDDDDGRRLYRAGDHSDVVVVAFGKASAAMAEAACEVLSRAFPGLPTRGVCIVKDDHATPEQTAALLASRVVVREASHPLPDERGVAATREVLAMLSETTPRTLTVFLVSGGGSSLLTAPRPPLTLRDVANASDALLASGLSIQDMNAVRRRLDAVKGGRLATAAHPSTVLTCVLSDVVGDPLDAIASGPTVGRARDVDDEEWSSACDRLRAADVLRGLPPAVRAALSNDNDDDRVTLSHPVFRTAETVLVGNNERALTAAARAAERLGYAPVILSTTVDGEARHVARVYTALAQPFRATNRDAIAYRVADPPVALLAGGETTVTLRVDDDDDNARIGRGGRNQEIGLAAALALRDDGATNVVLASVGTDGTDGPNDAAGAMVDGGTVDRIERRPNTTLTAEEALRRHDSHTFFLQGECNNDDDDRALVVTGPTGTNVADICVILVR